MLDDFQPDDPQPEDRTLDSAPGEAVANGSEPAVPVEEGTDDPADEVGDTDLHGETGGGAAVDGGDSLAAAETPPADAPAPDELVAGDPLAVADAPFDEQEPAPDDPLVGDPRAAAETSPADAIAPELPAADAIAPEPPTDALAEQPPLAQAGAPEGRITDALAEGTPADAPAPGEPTADALAEGSPPADAEVADDRPARARRRRAAVREPGPPAPVEPAPLPPSFIAPTFVAPEPVPVPVDEPVLATPPVPDREPAVEAVEPPATPAEADADDDGGGTRRRRRGRRGRGRAREDAAEGAEQQPDPGRAEASEADPEGPQAEADSSDRPEGGPEGEESTPGGRRRRRRRRRAGNDGEEATADEPEEVPTVVHVRPPRPAARRSKDEDEVQGVKGSTRLEAKRQRRRDGRDGGRRRPSVISESEFLARREAVDRVMVVREGRDRTQIGVLEDGVLVEHYVTRATAASYVGNVYLGRVQNVLPSMEAAFVDIGKGRNAVLYAGEVNYDASQFEGKPHRIEQALKSGDKVLVQVSKDPIGSKGSRLTSQISLPGRYVVYIPEGQRTGISRKLPDTERARLKSILKRVAPEDAGLIVRTAAEGASEDELARDMARLVAQWEVIQKKAATASPPALLHAEPDLVIRVIRDVFNEDFTRMVVQGDREWDTIEAYVEHVAPDLRERLERWTDPGDVFAAHRVDEQLAKALDRKVWLPSGGYLVFDRTEAMIVVDVNTGKFTGKGGNLEETVTKNNLEAAEELVRQLRLRDLGGIIVVDFIDMVLEANRDLVLRRLLECLGRDRTKHQVAEVTSLGLVQMTRKRVGQGLQDAFAQTCPECHGSGIKTIVDPFAPADGARAVPRPVPRPAPRPHPAHDGDAPDADVAATDGPADAPAEAPEGSPDGAATPPPVAVAAGAVEPEAVGAGEVTDGV